MSPRQIHLVRESFARFDVNRAPAGESIYRHIFAAAPTIQALFRGDIHQHAMNLMGAISMVVQALDRLETVLPAIQALGRRHAGYGVTGQHLELGGRALRLALIDHDEGLSPEIEMAWSAAYTILSGVMLEAAAPAAAA